MSSLPPAASSSLARDLASAVTKPSFAFLADAGYYNASVVAAVAALLLLAAYGRRTEWAWALFAASVVGIAWYERASQAVQPARSEETRRAIDAIRDYTIATGGRFAHLREDQPPFMPELFSVSRLQGKESWLRGDRSLVDALRVLVPFSGHDGFRVRTIMRMLGEFYFRYDRVLNRPDSVHVKNEYTLMYDLHLRVLNSIHELYFTKPLPLCRELPVLLGAAHGRMYRMLRVLRNKYPRELRGVSDTRGSAPRAYDTGTNAHEMFV